MSASAIKVPIDRPPGWAPAWTEKYADIQVPRTLDLGDLLADMGRTLVSVAVSADPALTVQVVTTSATEVLLRVGGGTPGGKQAVRFLLELSGDVQDEVVAWQPVRAAAPAGLVPIGVPAGNDNTLLLLVL